MFEPPQNFNGPYWQLGSKPPCVAVIRPLRGWGTQRRPPTTMMGSSYRGKTPTQFLSCTSGEAPRHITYVRTSKIRTHWLMEVVSEHCLCISVHVFNCKPVTFTKHHKTFNFFFVHDNISDLREKEQLNLHCYQTPLSKRMDLTIGYLLWLVLLSKVSFGLSEYLKSVSQMAPYGPG